MVIQVLNRDIEQALRQLKKQGIKSGLYRELKKRQYYVKPSEARRLKHKRALTRTRKQQRREEQDNGDL